MPISLHSNRILNRSSRLWLVPPSCLVIHSSMSFWLLMTPSQVIITDSERFQHLLTTSPHQTRIPSWMRQINFQYQQAIVTLNIKSKLIVCGSFSPLRSLPNAFKSGQTTPAVNSQGGKTNHIPNAIQSILAKWCYIELIECNRFFRSGALRIEAHIAYIGAVKQNDTSLHFILNCP